ncbi:MAG: hypothetical protein WAN16_01780, partial [Chthoniobacterales bacterium]
MKPMRMMLEFMAMILPLAVPEGTKEWRSGRKSGERGVKMVRNVTRLQGYKVWLFAIGSGEMFRKRHGMSFTQRT